MAANYHNSAWFYDRLARFVYGKALVNAQVYLLKHIPANSTILIVGGGTGWVLEELTKIHPSGLIIIYVEVAPSMMAQSQKRYTGSNEITFINDAVENIDLPPDFNVVITPFLLDNFTEVNLNKIFIHIHKALKKEGLWLNASFQLKGKWWHWILLKAMFAFFKVMCGIEALKLPPVNDLFVRNNYWTLHKKEFYGHFIGSKVYRKS
jgi:ubiquinone/menaquinone biosynthesis C-methylase UbiE